MALRHRIFAGLTCVTLMAGCRSWPVTPSREAFDLSKPATRAAQAEPTTTSPDIVAQAAYVQEEIAEGQIATPEELLPPELPPREFPGGEPGDETAELMVGELNLLALEQMALANNPTLRQAAALVAEARGRWVQAGLYPNPQIGYQGSEINADRRAGQQGGFLSQTVVTGGKLNWSRAAAAREVDRAQAEMQAQQLRVLTDVRVRFYEALGAQQTVALAEVLRSIAQQGVRIARQLEQALEAPHTDVLQSEVELATVELLLETSRQREFAARQALAAVVGVPDLPCVPLVGTLEDELLPLEWCTAYERLLASSPLLQIAQARIARARAQMGREQAEPIPDLNFQIGSQYDFGSDDTIYSAQVQLPIPFYDRNQGNIMAAAAELRQAMDEAARIELMLQRRLAEVWRRYAAAQTQVEIYRSRILPRAQRTLDLTSQAYEGGQLDFLRVLTARRSFFDNRLRYLEALIDLRQATAELDGLLLTGGLDAPGDVATSDDQD